MYLDEHVEHQLKAFISRFVGVVVDNVIEPDAIPFIEVCLANFRCFEVIFDTVYNLVKRHVMSHRVESVVEVIQGATSE